MNDSHSVVEEWVSFQIFDGETTMDVAGKKSETSFSLAEAEADEAGL